MTSDYVPQRENVSAEGNRADNAHSVIPIGIDSIIFVGCMATIRIPAVCARIAASASAKAAQKNATPASTTL